MERPFALDDPCTRPTGHEDPDNSGLCIFCGGVLDPTVEEIQEAIDGGRDPATLKESMEWRGAWDSLMADRQREREAAPQ
jgi:hypothetical protein